MPNVTINGEEYDYDSLGDESKQQVANLQFVQVELKRLESQIAALRTAAAAYSQALGQSMAKKD